ncbi:MAG: hypothetical protein II951_07150 [Bacteroidales bacterium]|nr:hypothetical protein [Bacteroidales bacterium]
MIKKILKWTGIIVGAFAILIVLAAIFDSGSSSDIQPPDVDELTNPTHYVRLNNNEIYLKESSLLFDDQYALRGSIKNTACYCKLDDILIQIRYYSKNDVLLDTQHYLIDLSLEPWEEKTFDLNVKRPSDTNEYKVEILDAKTTKVR